MYMLRPGYKNPENLPNFNKHKSHFRERCFFVLSRAWDKEKDLNPLEKSNLRSSDSAL